MTHIHKLLNEIEGVVLCVISIFGQKPVSPTQKTLMAHIGCSLLFRKFAKFAAPSLRKFSFLHGNFCHLGCIKTLMDPHFFRSGHGQIGIHLCLHRMCRKVCHKVFATHFRPHKPSNID